jgi:transcriptional regulator with XRE-family HTH domain
MQIGEKIRKLREERHYSQEYMALKLGISQQEYSRIEGGQSRLSIERAQLIAETFGVDISFIMGDGNSHTFNNTNQQGGDYANNFHYHGATEYELKEKISLMQDKIILLKEEITNAKDEIALLKRELVELKAKL